MITQSTFLPLTYGTFKIAYHKFGSDACVSVSHGNLQANIPIVRIHSSCLFGEAFHGLDCDCRQQLDSTLKLIRDHGHGVVIYQFAEGRGIGIEAKIKALELQRTNRIDTVEAFKLMGLPPDLRTYEGPVQALKDLKVFPTVIFASQNPRKIKAMRDAGYEIRKRISPQIEVTDHNRNELLAKKYKLNYHVGDI